MISSVGSQIQAYGVHKSDMPQTKNQQPPNTTNQVATGTDSAMISTQGKHLSETTLNNLPLEAYSIPSWMADYCPDAVDLSAESDLSRWESEPDIMRQEYTEKQNYRSKYSDELSEYTGKLNGYFQESLRDRGIEPGLDYYQNIVLNNENSAQIHQDVKEKLAGDDRMMELMDLFKIDL